jgi:hypothetical protein
MYRQNHPQSAFAHCEVPWQHVQRCVHSESRKQFATRKAANIFLPEQACCALQGTCFSIASKTFISAPCMAAMDGDRSHVMSCTCMHVCISEPCKAHRHTMVTCMHVCVRVLPQ